jgi:hypothetical protein
MFVFMTHTACCHATLEKRFFFFVIFFIAWCKAMADPEDGFEYYPSLFFQLDHFFADGKIVCLLNRLEFQTNGIFFRFCCRFCGRCVLYRSNKLILLVSLNATTIH